MNAASAPCIRPPRGPASESGIEEETIFRYPAPTPPVTATPGASATPAAPEVPDGLSLDGLREAVGNG